MTRSEIQFWFRGSVQRVSGVPVSRTVLQWLREDMKAHGTKEGCAEGDCGACTVVVGSLDSKGALELRAVNSCIQLLPSLDGKALFTVEDLSAGGTLHPVQDAMVRQNGSQCGFCTPGFVMSLWADYQDRKSPPDRQEAAEVVSGNLCRCTGYRPILDAAAAAWDGPRVLLDREPVCAALESIAALPPLDYREGGGRFSAPQTVSALSEAYAERPSATLLAGSTDVGLWITKQMRDIPDFIYTGAAAELREIDEDPSYISIGAGVSLQDAFARLADDEPVWTEFGRRFASRPVRNAGTLGGNVANGSPIGDSMPALIALGSRVVLRRRGERRRLPLEDFYLGYRKTALASGEFLEAVEVPKRTPERFFRAWKVSKRTDQDISAVCAAFSWSRDSSGKMRGVRIGFGGVAEIPKRARKTEAALEGRVFDEAILAAAQAAVAADFAPLSDMRASDEYRRTLCINLLQRLFFEASGSPSTLAEIKA